MEKLMQKCKELGANAAKIIPITDVVFRAEFRDMCKMNNCGKYNTNWGCPPGCGDIDEMMAQAKSFESLLVFQTVSMLEDSFDYEGMQNGKKYYNEVSAKIQEAFKKEFPQVETLYWNAGGCKVCAKCAKIDNLPCRFPEKRTISMEGYGVDVTELAKSCGMNYINGQNTVTYFGAILFRGIHD